MITLCSVFVPYLLHACHAVSSEAFQLLEMDDQETEKAEEELKIQDQEVMEILRVAVRVYACLCVFV